MKAHGPVSATDRMVSTLLWMFDVETRLDSQVDLRADKEAKYMKAMWPALIVKSVRLLEAPRQIRIIPMTRVEKRLGLICATGTMCKYGHACTRRGRAEASLARVVSAATGEALRADAVLAEGCDRNIDALCSAITRARWFGVGQASLDAAGGR